MSGDLFERLRKLMARATALPWCWEQCGEKQDDPVLGLAFPADDEDGKRPIAGRLTDDEAYRYGRIADGWHSCDGHSASANIELVTEALNALPTLLDLIATLQAREAELVEALKLALPLLEADREVFFQAHTIDRDPRSLTNDEALIVTGYDAALHAARTTLSRTEGQG